MKSILSIALMLFLVGGLPIQSIGQITLTNNQFDFYAKALIRERGLKIDTLNLRANLKDCERTNVLLSSKFTEMEYAFGQEKQHAENFKISLTTLQEKYDNKVKWNICYKKIIVCVSVLAILEGGLIYIAFH